MNRKTINRNISKRKRGGGGEVIRDSVDKVEIWASFITSLFFIHILSSYSSGGKIKYFMYQSPKIYTG